MELALLVYGISFLGNLTGFLGCLIAVIIFMIVIYHLNGATSKSLQKHMIAVLVLGFCTVLIPSKKTMYVMVGAYAAQKVAQSPETRIISEKVLKVIEKELDKQINEVKSTRE